MDRPCGGSLPSRNTGQIQIHFRVLRPLIQRHSQIPAQRHHQRGEHLTAATIMIVGRTRTLRDVDPLPPAIRIGRRVGATAERHTALHIPDQLPVGKLGSSHGVLVRVSCPCQPGLLET